MANASPGHLWVGTDGEPTFQIYTEQDGLPNGVIYTIRPDEEGGLWMSTNKGLSRFDLETETFTNFDSRHGLQSDEFNFGAGYRAQSGELFFGGVNGYNAFHPRQLLDRISPEETDTGAAAFVPSPSGSFLVAFDSH